MISNGWADTILRRPGQVIKRETIKTRLNWQGHTDIRIRRAKTTIKDFQYGFEARVTDSSRRELLPRTTCALRASVITFIPRPERISIALKTR